MNANITQIVINILSSDKVARCDDYYLYTKVIKEVSPDLLTRPLGAVLMGHFDNGLVNFETVRRARAHIQSRYPHLVDENLRRMRRAKSETYINTLNKHMQMLYSANI